MRFERRLDIDDEVLRTYQLDSGPYEIQHPIAVYSTPGLEYEGVLDDDGKLHLVPRPGACGVHVIRTPTSGEPLVSDPF